MKFYPVLLASMAALITASGSVSAQEASCEDAVTTVDMIECAQKGFDIADGNLNSTYQGLRKDLDEEGRNLLRDAQRAWINFRDAECARQADTVRGGTMAPLIAISCLTSMTQERTKELIINPVTGESN